MSSLQERTQQSTTASRGQGSDEVSAVITQMPAVNWLNPAQLSVTALRAVLGSVFGAYADRREVQAALGPDAGLQDLMHLDYSKREELWLDYVADLGDGWDATYSVAWLISQQQIRLREAGADLALPRGEVLLMGGDQVYPTASHIAYEQRFKGPYTAALPHVENSPLLMLAIPGNHDWYDGVGGFLRLFCQQRWIGARKTLQRRSYFAARLPHRWWLWAVDIQLGTDIDHPQKQYFQCFAEELQAGDRVIICSPVPTWVAAGDARNVPDPDAAAAHPNLTYLESLVRGRGADVRLSVAGDSHHYAHYEQQDAAPGAAHHKLTAGGGGAFLHGTQALPDRLCLQEDGDERVYALKNAYPERLSSRLMSIRNLALCWFNPAFAGFLGVLYLFYAWIWQSASKGMFGLNDSLMLQLSRLPFSVSNAVHEAVPALWRSVAHEPGALLLSCVPIAALFAFAAAPPRKWAGLRRFAWGLIHGLAHMLLALLLLWLFARINLSAIAHHIGVDPLAWVDSAPQLLLISLEVAITGFALGGSMFGLYLALSNLLSGMHDEEVYSALHIADHKNFLRLHVSRDALTIHALKVDEVCRKWRISTHARQVVASGGWFRPRTWRFRIDRKDERPWFEPARGQIKVELIEKIVIPTTTGA